MRWNGLSFLAAILAASDLLDSPIGDLDKRGVDFVDDAGAKDNLHLTGVIKAALNPFDFADGLLIGQRIIDQHQAQPRGAVRGAGDIFLTSQQRKQRAGNVFEIHSTL